MGPLSSSARWVVRTFAVAALMAVCVASPAAAAVTIGVDDRQLVTMSGRSDSLRQVLIELFSEAEVEIREFGISDRTVAVDYDGLPLHRVLARLLRGESYVVGLRRLDDTAVVSWVKIFGPEANDAAVQVAAAAAPMVQGGDFGVTAETLQTALASANAMDRAKAVNKVLAAVRANPGLVDEYMDRDIGALADEIYEHPFVIELLNAVRRTHHDNVIKMKVDALVRTVRLKRTPPDAGKKYKFLEHFKGNQGGG